MSRILDVHIGWSLKFRIHYHCLAFEEIWLSSIFLGHISISNFIAVLLFLSAQKFRFSMLLWKYQHGRKENIFSKSGIHIDNHDMWVNINHEIFLKINMQLISRALSALNITRIIRGRRTSPFYASVSSIQNSNFVSMFSHSSGRRIYWRKTTNK